VGPRAGLEGQKISSPPGFDPGPSRPYSVAIPTELPGSQVVIPSVAIFPEQLEFYGFLSFWSRNYFF